jgi:exopolysaccharide production protein ExoZ
MRFGKSFTASFFYFENFGAIGVDIFFVISGAIMTIITISSPLTPKHFFIRRCIRILPLYWILSFFCCIISLYGFWPAIKKEEILETLIIIPFFNLGYFTGPVLFLGWTLSFEFFFYIIFTFALWINKKQPLIIILATLLPLVLIGYLFPNITEHRFKFATNAIILEFLMGCICGYIYLGNIKLSMRFTYVITFTGLLLMILPVFYGFGKISEMAYTLDGTLSMLRIFKWGVPAFLLVTGIVMMEKNGKLKVPGLLVTIGNISYSAYLVHIFCVMFLSALWHRLHIVTPDLFILTAVLFSLFTAYLFYYFIENPLTNYLNKKFLAYTLKKP